MSVQIGPSLYEQIGGISVINKAVDYFYYRVHQHERLTHFFRPINVKAQSAHQKAFIAHALGGFPSFRNTSTMDTTSPFEDMNLTAQDVEDINKIIEESMEYVGISRSLIDQLMTLLRATKDEVISSKYGLF